MHWHQPQFHLHINSELFVRVTISSVYSQYTKFNVEELEREGFPKIPVFSTFLEDYQFILEPSEYVINWICNRYVFREES